MQTDTCAGAELRRIGGEYGVTTGRPRRCGWLDLVMLRRAVELNSFTECVLAHPHVHASQTCRFALTKLDVLDTFASILVCVAYTLDGHTLNTPPTSESDLKRVKCVYDTLPGWQSTTSGAHTFVDLPPAAQRYVHRIERETNTYGMCALHRCRRIGICSALDWRRC
jgi:adenylosuccinate synthase